MKTKVESREREREREREYNDLFSIGSRYKISEGNRCSNDASSERLEGNGDILFKCSNYPATVRRSINGKFLSVDELYVDDINKEIANTVLARYWKGIEGDNSNCVVVEYE